MATGILGVNLIKDELIGVEFSEVMEDQASIISFIKLDIGV